MLAPLQVRRRGQPLPLRGAQRTRLLALLAARPGETASLDALVEALWTTPPPTAVKTVRVQVRALRHHLEDDPASPSVLVTRPGGYALELAPHQIDLHRFNALVRHGRELLDAGLAARAADRFREALELWHDPPLPDLVDVASQAPTVAEARSRALAAQEGVLLSLLELGRHREVLAQVEPLLLAEPLREELYALALLAHYREGEQAEALAVAARAREVLREELGVEPGVGLARLEHAVLTQQPDLLERHAADGRAATSSFVGRAAELVVLGEAWRAASAGHGSMALLAGDPGMGKTRLARELAEQVRAAGGRVAWAGCWAGTAPFSAPASWLHQLDDGTGDGAGELPVSGAAPAGDLGFDAGAHQRAVDDLLAALGRHAGAGPLLLVLDDLHDVDHATAGLLQQLRSRLESWPVLLVATMRAAAVDHGSALQAALPELSADDRVARLDLRPLSRDETHRYLAVALGAPDEALADAVWRRAAGNVLFTVELAAQLQARDEAQGSPDALPDALRVHVRRVLDRLGPDAAEVMDAAAVLGPESSVRSLATLVHDEQRTLAGLAEAEERRLLHSEDGTTWRFTHELVLDAVYEAVAPARRRELHLAAAAELARHPAPSGADVEERARHHVAALPAEPAACATACLAAAEAAMAVWAFEDAARWSEAALRATALLPDDVDLARRGELRHGEVLLRAGRTDAARAHLERAADLARADADPDALATAAFLLVADRVAGPGDDAEGFALLREADEALGDRDDELKVRILDRLSLALIQDDLAASRALAEEALARAERDGGERVLALARNGLAMALAGPALGQQRLAHCTAAVEAARRAPDPESVLVGRLLRILTLLELGRAGEADAELDLVVAAADERREPRYRWMAEGWRGVRAMRAGAYEEAEARFTAGFERWEGQPTPDAVLALGVQTVGLRLLQGRAEEVRALVDSSAAEAGGSPTWFAVRALVLASAGDDAEASRALEACLATDPRSWPEDVTWTLGVSAAAEAGARLGHEPACEVLLPLLLPHRDKHVALTAFGAGGAYWGCLAHPAGLAAACLGEREQARALLEQALAEHRRVGAEPFAARSAAALAAR